MSASDPDVCNVYNDPRFRKGKDPAAAKGTAAGITAEGFREFCRGLSARALGWPELDAAAESLEGGERMRRMVEALAERYESTREEMRGSVGWTPRCPLCAAVVPAHAAGCDFGRFLGERRAAAKPAAQRPPAPQAAGGTSGAIARQADETVDGLVEALGRARIPCHGGCRRNSHMTSDCPSTHFIKRPCECQCDCPAGPHNAAIDAAIAKARISGIGVSGSRGSVPPGEPPADGFQDVNMAHRPWGSLA
jgi:hypothetical protein